VYPDRLIAPGRLEVRQVVEGTQGHAMPADPKGPEASTLEELVAKIGQATWARVTNLDGVSGEMFRGFAELTPREVRLLPARVQFQVPTVGCEQLTADPFGAAAPPDTQVTACLDHEKLLLDRTAISGTDVADAMAEEVKRPGDFIEYRVRLKLTPTGRAKWTDLTRRVAAKQGCVPVPGSAPCRLAFVVDGKVLSAPVILNPMGADEAVITGLYTQAEARGLAVTLGPRELPPGLKLTSR
jgi:preprotein translocase subunit SecD